MDIEEAIADFRNLINNNIKKDSWDNIECAKAGWRDVCRTYRGCSRLPKNEFVQIKESAFKRVAKFLGEEFNDEGDYERAFYAACGELMSIFNDKYQSPVFHFGQAQKVVAMATKYKVAMIDKKPSSIKSWLHCPIDSIVFEKAKIELGIAIPKAPWSRMNKEDYLAYHDQIKKAAMPNPLTWEFINWKQR